MELDPNIRRRPVKRQFVSTVEIKPKNAYLPRGQNSQDTPKVAQRRREIKAIQQKHRMLNRRGVPHSQTPPLYRLEQPEPAPLQNLAPTPLSSQEAAAVEQDATATKQDATAAKQDANAADAPAESPLPVSAVNWQRIEIFREKLQQETIETCSRCNERWFQMHLATQGDDIGIYKACVKDAKSLKYPSEPFLFSNANNIDPGTVSKHLPILTEVEEMIIARVYVHLQVARVRGQQYQYTKHVVCFGQNTPKT